MIDYNPSLSDLKLNPYNDLEEISIQDEVIDFISGADFGIDKFNPYIHKALRRDKYGTPLKCTCWDEFANEGKDDCPYCDGIGFYWKEVVIPGVFFLLNKRKIVNVLNQSDTAGREDSYEIGFITKFNTELIQQDLIIEPHLNNQGFFQYPYKIKIKYVVKETVERRLDLGRKEYNLTILGKVL